MSSLKWNRVGFLCCFSKHLCGTHAVSCILPFSSAAATGAHNWIGCHAAQTLSFRVHNAGNIITKSSSSWTQFKHVRKSWNPCVLHARPKSYGTADEISTVEKELKDLMGRMRSDVTRIQMELFQALCNDVSDHTPQLVAKLNSELKVSADDVFVLAKAVLKAKNKVADDSFLMAIAASLFGCSGDMGNKDAHYFYAQILCKGQGVEKNLTKAAEIFDKLALGGHPFAQFTLGSMYYFGSGVKQNFKTAYTLFKVSAQNYVPQANNMLGNLHRNGEGVEKDIKQAVEYYLKGCEFDDPSAHMNMGYCYSNGEGVEKSPEKAFKHYLEASKVNNPIALHNVGTSYLSGVGAEKDYTKAKEYFEKACILEFHPAQINLGNMYYTGVGVEKDVAKAKELFHLAAQQDGSSAKYLEMIEEEEKKLRK